MYSVEIENNGGSIMKARSKDYEFIVDTKGKGMTPPDTLLTSLGSCVGVYINKYIEGAKLPISGFKVKVDADFSKEKPVRFETINVSIELKGPKLDDKRKEALLSFIKNCPVGNTLNGKPNIEVELM